MKKKIINGILLVAMLFAATTSFVSCKDNVDDELTLVYGQLAKQKSELSARIDNLEGQISSLQSELSNVKADVSTIKGQIATLQSDVNDLKGRLAAVETQIATLSAEVDTIKSDLAALTERVDGIEDNVNKLIALLAEGMITEIATNQTVNDVFGTINVPGFNAKVLAALFGDNQTYIEKFPVTGADYNVFADGTTLDASDIAGAKFIELYDDYISKPTGNAGKFFFTANSLDKSLFDINDWTLSLEASDGTVAPVYFENVQPSDYNIQWGAYKSVVLGSNEAETDLGFYEADATIDREYLEQCKLNARNYINFGDLKKDIQAAVETIKAAEGKKATLISIAKEAAQLVEKYVSGQLSGDNRYLDNPTYSAQRLVMTKTIEDVAVRFQDADLDVALTAIAPLSYNSFWQLEKDAKTPSLESIENAIAKFFKKIAEAIPEVKVNGNFPVISKVDLTGSKAYVVASDDKTYAGDIAAAMWVDLPKEIADAINNGLKVEELNDALQNLSVTVDLGPTADNLASRFNSYLERAANGIVNALKKHALTRAVSPIILYKSTQGINRLVSGTKVKAGYMQINMTSPTEELIVPPYEKYIAVKDASGKITESATVPGNTQLWTLDLTKAGDYTVILSCVDYYGYVVTKKYEITVE
ncbi:MAG: DUF1664 domain-containing protein [Prevotella sp.]|nr:DUF1664 domain-containing protein [Prevotella sp.]